MGVLNREHQVIVGKKPQVIRRQHCKRCNTVLAIEYTDKMGYASHSTYEWLRGGVWVKERWYGNWTRCPNCGLEGTLPGDKPLSYEEIKNRKELNNAKAI